MDCDRCGKDVDTHPTVDVSNTERLALCQDRAPKWQRVEPGTVIPAGQPHRIERVLPYDCTIPATNPPQPDMDRRDWFIDSSWKPPLVLPTTPTWGIAIHRTYGAILSQWWMDAGEDFIKHNGGSYRAHNITDFIPCTEEQVARIEAAR